MASLTHGAVSVAVNKMLGSPCVCTEYGSRERRNTTTGQTSIPTVAAAVTATFICNSQTRRYTGRQKGTNGTKRAKTVQGVSVLLLQGFADHVSGISLHSLAHDVAPFCLETQTEKQNNIVGQCR